MKREFVVSVQIEVDGKVLAAVRVDTNDLENIKYLMANIPLAYSLTLSKQLREEGVYGETKAT